jgi:hypothetical protein
MNEGGAIEVGGFKIVREALSATYGLLFTLFVFRAWLESRVAWKICKAETVVPISAVETKAVLWLVSPFSWFRALRWVFWGLLADGFITLAVFSAIHIGNVRSLPNWLKLVESGIAPPGNSRPITLPPWAYKGIGYMDLVLLLVCLWPCVGLIQNLTRIRKRFTRSEGPV